MSIGPPNIYCLKVNVDATRKHGKAIVVRNHNTEVMVLMSQPIQQVPKPGSPSHYSMICPYHSDRHIRIYARIRQS